MKAIKYGAKVHLYDRKCQCAGEKSDGDIYGNAATHPSHALTAHRPNTFRTAYAPDREDIVYCEECYNAEVA